MAAAIATLLLSSLLSLLLLFPSPSAANESNILLTGDVLPTDGQLSNGPNGANFVIQDDCNLVLYNKGVGFASKTYNLGTNCTLTLTEFGQLLIKSVDGSIIWLSSSPGPKGKYAAILQRDGQLGIYGPSVWSIPLSNNLNAKPISAAEEGLPSEHAVQNLLFSSEVLKENERLVSRDYALEVKEGECKLEFSKALVGVVWRSPHSGAGKHCYARLNFRGQLAVLNDNNKIMWKSKPAATEGTYVLAVQINGQAVLYGPRFWSTA